ncbi:MAG TPA: type I-C CRISPR-associated protein Cas5c [Candidatus Sumerlaeota bacterium]|nr:type I-C CRISPR-associated protein Cas5c [Candidatus Sumerlaeota bacterium]
MNDQHSRTLRVRASGPLACFTRPELKVERMSYPVMTPSAARGILEAILWKPAIAWRVKRILVLGEISFTSFRRNEVGNRVPTFKNTPPGDYYADEDRQQRNTVALANVDYIIEAHFELTKRAGSDDTVRKFEEMFQRRVEKGQHFHQPYFGCREFAANVEAASGQEKPVNDSRDLGLMLHDIDFGCGGKNIPRFFPAKLDHGILTVPPWEGNAAP